MQNRHYRNRDDAAHQLAETLSERQWSDPVVLGVPRGGIPMARIVAERLGASLDVVLVHKIRAPENPEYAVGSVDEAGHVTLAGDTHGRARDPAIQREIAEEQSVLESRRARYGQPRQTLTDRDVIIVDDGAATGATIEAAINAVQAAHAAQVVVALGIAAPDVVARLERLADFVLCPSQPRAFMAVSQGYDEFDQVSDEQVERILAG